MMDMNTADTQELVEAVGGAAGIVILAPPTQGPASDALAAIVGSCKSKQKLLIAESYGGQDEPVDTLAVKFASLGLAEVVPALRVKADPTESTYQLFEESGTDLGQVLTKKEALRAIKSAMSPDVARASVASRGSVRGDRRAGHGEVGDGCVLGRAGILRTSWLHRRHRQGSRHRVSHAGWR